MAAHETKLTPEECSELWGVPVESCLPSSGLEVNAADLEIRRKARAIINRRSPPKDDVGFSALISQRQQD